MNQVRRNLNNRNVTYDVSDASIKYLKVELETYLQTLIKLTNDHAITNLTIDSNNDVSKVDKPTNFDIKDQIQKSSNETIIVMLYYYCFFCNATVN